MFQRFSTLFPDNVLFHFLGEKVVLLPQDGIKAVLQPLGGARVVLHHQGGIDGEAGAPQGPP